MQFHHQDLHSISNSKDGNAYEVAFDQSKAVNNLRNSSHMINMDGSQSVQK